MRARSLLLPLVLGLLAPASAHAQAVQLKIGQPRLGYLAENDPGWFPVSVPLENTGAAMSVKIVATILDRSMGADGVAERTVLLPEKSRRVETLYLRVSETCSGVRVAVLGTNGHTLFERQRTLNWRQMTREPPIPFHALLVREGLTDPARIDWLAARTTAPGVVGVALTRDWVEARELPDRPVGYDGVDLVALSETSTRDLDEPRRSALLAWVRGGGRVLLLPGADPTWFRDELPQSLLPRDLTITPVEVPGLPELEKDLHSLKLLRLPPVSPFRVYVARSAEAPFPVHVEKANGQRYGAFSVWKFGAGDVILCALDLEAPPFDHWPHAKEELARQLWNICHPVPGMGSSRRRIREGRLNPWFEQAAEESELPSPLLLIPVVVAYILCVGPLNQKLVRRLDNPVLSVVTIPLISTAFAGVVFGAGYVVRGSTMGLDRLTVVEARPGEDSGWQWSAIRIRSAASATYRISADARLVAKQAQLNFETTDRSEGEHRGTGKLVIQDEGRFAFPDLPLNLWERAFFEAHGPCPLGAGISIAIGATEGTITNGSTLPLGAGVLFVSPADQGVLVPPIAAGGSARVDLSARTVKPERNEIVRALQGEGEQNRIATRSLDGFLDSVRSETSYVALLPNPPGSLELDDRARPSRELAVLIVQAEDDLRENDLATYAEAISRMRHAVEYEDALAALARIRLTSRHRSAADGLALRLEARKDLRDSEIAFGKGDAATGRRLLRPHLHEILPGEAEDRELVPRLAVCGQQAEAFEDGLTSCRKGRWADALSLWRPIFTAGSEGQTAFLAGTYFHDMAKARSGWLRKLEALDGDELKGSGESALKKGLFWEAEVALRRSAEATAPPGRTELEGIVAAESSAQSLLSRAETLVKAQEPARTREARELVTLLATYLPDGNKDRPRILELQKLLATQGSDRR